jgi:hypothetical protein
MSKFDLSKFEGVFGIGLFGATISCFIVYLVCNLLAKDPANLSEVTNAQLMIGFYTMVTGLLTFSIGGSLLILNALRVRRSESKGTPTLHVLLVLLLTLGMIVASILIPLLI